MKTVFIHGGPGLNSKPEQSLFLDFMPDLSDQLYFWNEPRVYSERDPYNELSNSLISYMLSFDEKVNVIAHSSGCRLFLSCYESIKHKINKVCFSAPAINFDYASDQIIATALNIFSKIDKEKEVLLKSYLPKLTKEFDLNRQEAILLAMSSNYFIKNFNTVEGFEKYFSYLSGENEFNLESYIKVRRSMRDIEKIDKIENPLICFLGKNDPIFDVEHSKKEVSKYFENVNFYIYENSSHYPHVDNMSDFFELYLSFIG